MQCEKCEPLFDNREPLTSNQSSDPSGPGTATPAFAPSPDWPGYLLLPNMDPYCSVAVSVAPKDFTTPLFFIPCPDGQVGCESPKWRSDKEEQSLGSPRPSGKLAMDLETNQVRFALRSSGYTVNASGMRSGELEILTTHLAACDGSLFGASSGAWLLASSTNGGEQLFWFANGNTTPVKTWQLPAVGEKDAVLSSDDALVVSKPDGQRLILNKSDDAPTTTYGPGRRLWPKGVFGSVIFLSSAGPQFSSFGTNPTEEQAFVYQAGNFIDLGIKGGHGVEGFEHRHRIALLGNRVRLHAADRSPTDGCHLSRCRCGYRPWR